MKSALLKILIVLALILILQPIQVTQAQVQRNPVLEYCTGTWCQWCPCGHTIIKNNILPNIPNAVILSYHGPANSSDPFRNFNGNGIIPALGFSGYPTGIIDRTSAPVSRGVWYSNMLSRNSQAAKVDLHIIKQYDNTTRELNVIAFAKSLETLEGLYNINFVVTESGLVHPQTGNSSCPGGTNYIHDHVVRNMINGHLGDTLSKGSQWRSDIWYIKNLTYEVPTAFVDTNMQFISFVYKQNSPLNLGEIQQAVKQELTVDNPYPADAFEFTAATTMLTDTLGSELVFDLDFANNAELPLILNFTRTQNDLPVGWTSQMCYEDSCFDYLTDFISTTPDYGSKFLVPEESRKLYVKVFTDVTVGTGIIKIEAENFYNPDDKIEIELEANGIQSTVSVDPVEKPFAYNLEQNYPNPFNPSTLITYSIPQSGHVSLKVYDMMGSEIAVLVNEVKNSGIYKVEFDAANLSSGVYVYKLISGNYSAAKKMTILK